MKDVEKLDWWKSLTEVYLNLGGGTNRHGAPHYNNYISVNHPVHYQNVVVDLKTGKRVPNKLSLNGDAYQTAPEWRGERPFNICHDLTKPFPLADNSVDRILSEDCFEHLEAYYYPSIFYEMYRILKPGGIFRLACPDYRNLKDRFCIELGFDPRNELHVTITTYDLMKKYIDMSPFDHVGYVHYWKSDDMFVKNDIDYSLGWVKRTPDNDARNVPDNPLCVTSLIVDLVKKDMGIVTCK